ncbi:DUF488 family protein [Microbaculum marinisediminis]|uniref:DUF488 domain-containing protein n=1 Tax=Microbaculum marinisediminis TaxID=2931392 RepID=A0AAW5QXI9_9HYPH|nr:DUF488 domain-containing protein [Microbaculum sp. A6E488]MCT8971682.1 DUF488 domain-containing protein [Microbaculum sp. A6E488]
MITTIGYEKSTQEDFVATLVERDIDVLIDIRERAQSRRRGFSKTALSLAVENAGIEYIHIRALGDPKEGRDAARAGMYSKFQKIFSQVLESQPAQDALTMIKSLASSKNVCLMCYERDHRQCHRKIVSDHLEVLQGLKTEHLEVRPHDPKGREQRRVFHSSQSAAT